MQTFGEANMAGMPEEKDRIVHATLKSDALSLMASNQHPSQQVKFGGNIHMGTSDQNEGRLTEIFNGLAQGGRVAIPLAKQFWGDTFGMLTDQFGVHWTVNVTSEARA